MQQPLKVHFLEHARNGIILSVPVVFPKYKTSNLYALPCRSFLSWQLESTMGHRSCPAICFGVEALDHQYLTWCHLAAIPPSMALGEPYSPSLYDIFVPAAFLDEIASNYRYEIALNVNRSSIAYCKRIALDWPVDWSPHCHNCPSAF